MTPPPRTPQTIAPIIFNDLELTGRYLDLLRDHVGLSCRQLHEAAGLSRSGLYRYLSDGACRIQLQHLIKILNLCGYDLTIVPVSDSRAFRIPKSE